MSKSGRKVQTLSGPKLACSRLPPCAAQTSPRAHTSAARCVAARPCRAPQSAVYNCIPVNSGLERNDRTQALYTCVDQPRHKPRHSETTTAPGPLPSTNQAATSADTQRVAVFGLESQMSFGPEVQTSASAHSHTPCKNPKHQHFCATTPHSNPLVQTWMCSRPVWPPPAYKAYKLDLKQRTFDMWRLAQRFPRLEHVERPDSA